MKTLEDTPTVLHQKEFTISGISEKGTGAHNLPNGEIARINK
jgi:hypothetical protein